MYFLGIDTSASNRRIVRLLREKIPAPVYSTPAPYARDNAVGNALVACRKFRNR